MRAHSVERRVRGSVERWLASFRRPSVTDDRGVRRPLVRRGDVGEGLSDFKRIELRSRIPVDRIRIAVMVLVALGGVLVARVGWLVITGQPVFVPGWWRLPQHGLGFVFWTTGLFLNMLRRSPILDFDTRVVAQCLRWEVCASCGYLLRDATEHEDGCVVCSECGAAWKRERVGGGKTTTG